MEEKVVRRASKSVSAESMCCMHGNGCNHGHNFSFIRIFLGIVLLLFVFCGGFKLGVLVGFIGSQGAHDGMYGYGWPEHSMVRYHKVISVDNMSGDAPSDSVTTTTRSAPIVR